MKFLPIVVSFLSAATLIRARPVDTPVDPVLGAINSLLAFLASLHPPPPTTPPTTTPPTTTPPTTDPSRPAAGFTRCTVIGAKDGVVYSWSCDGGPNCKKNVKPYKVGETIDFKCRMPGYDISKTDDIPPLQDWVRVEDPWAYFPTESLDEACQAKIKTMPVCPEANN